MSLPTRLAAGVPSHTVRVRVPRALWHRFLDACEALDEDSASEAVRQAMRAYVRSAGKGRVMRSLRRSLPR
jgi:hypothetical protein